MQDVICNECLVDVIVTELVACVIAAAEFVIPELV